MRVTEYAPAKLNLVLDVVGKRADGYHDLRTVMQTIDWCDTVTLDVTESGNITIDCDGGIPANADNTAYRAAALFREYTGMSFGCRITVQKSIPSQAGMGGGSADAAAVLRALNRVYGERLSVPELQRLAARIGADVPFCVCGGTALALGTGTELVPLPPLPSCYFVAVKPEGGVSTPEAYRRMDSVPHPIHPDVEAFCAALKRREWSDMLPHMQNSFEAPLALPHTDAITAVLREHGADAALMTGSGSAVFGLFLCEKKARAAAAALQQRYVQVRLCHPVGEK